MKRRDRTPRAGVAAGAAAALLLFGLLAAPHAAAQSNTSSSITIGAQLQGGGYFSMPNASVLLTAGFPLAGASLELVPRVGATYIFFPLTGLTGSWYVPIGMELRFRKQGLGIVVQNLLAIDNTLGEGGVTAGVEGYLPFAKAGKSLFSMAVEAGTAIFWNAADSPLFLVSLSASLRYAYQL